MAFSPEIHKLNLIPGQVSYTPTVGLPKNYMIMTPQKIQGHEK